MKVDVVGTACGPQAVVWETICVRSFSSAIGLLEDLRVF